MFKIIKWILVIGLILQVINYFIKREEIPINVVRFLEEHGCEGYEPVGIDLPFSFMIDTKTQSVVYLKNTYYKFTNEDVDVKVELFDPDPPLLKGRGDVTFSFKNMDLFGNFSHCYDRS